MQLGQIHFAIKASIFGSKRVPGGLVTRAQEAESPCYILIWAKRAQCGCYIENMDVFSLALYRCTYPRETLTKKLTGDQCTQYGQYRQYRQYRVCTTNNTETQKT